MLEQPWRVLQTPTRQRVTPTLRGEFVVDRKCVGYGRFQGKGEVLSLC